MKKGFTLVEVLGVIAVLGLVIGIIYPLMDEVLSNNANKLYQNQIESLEHQAENYTCVPLMSLSLAPRRAIAPVCIACYLTSTYHHHEH